MPPRSKAPTSEGGDPNWWNPFKSANVYLWIPNLIGYGRIVFAFLAFRVAFTQPLLFCAYYALSQLLDAFDGWAARVFSQSSQFGAVLDMVTDRFSTMILCAILSSLYPMEEGLLNTTTLTGHSSLLPPLIRGPLDEVLQKSNSYVMKPLLTSSWIRDFIYFFMVLDLVSHWYHMYSSLLTGSTSHKNMNTKNVFIRLYYTNRPMLFMCCACQEIFWGCLYLRANSSQLALALGSGISAHNITLFAHVLLIVALPLHIFKQFMNCLQMKLAMDSIMDFEAKKTKKGN